MLYTYLSCNWQFVPFDCLHPIPIPPPPLLVTTNLISFSVTLFACFGSIIDLQHLLVPVAQYNDSIILYMFKMITMIILVTVCHHTKILYIYWLSSHTVYFIPMTHSFCNWKFVTLTLPHLFLSFPSSGYLFVPCIYNYGSVLCLFIYFVLEIPHISEIK